MASVTSSSGLGEESENCNSPITGERAPSATIDGDVGSGCMIAEIVARDSWDRRWRGNRNPGGNGCGRRAGSLYRSRLRSGGGRYRRRGRNRGGCRSWSRGRCGRQSGNHQGLPLSRPTRTSYSPARSTLKGSSTVRVSPAPITNSSVWLICCSTHRLAKYVALELERLVTSTETVAAPPALML